MPQFTPAGPSLLANILNYGAVGLGLALAILAYLLLAREQRLSRPRLVTINVVYTFMALAFSLFIVGFVGEYMQWDFESLRTEVAAETTALTDLRARNENLEVKLQLVREATHSLAVKAKDLRQQDAANTHECAGTVQPVREQLADLAQRLDAVVNR